MSNGEWAYQDDDGNKLILAECHDDDLNKGHVHVDMTGAGPVCIPPGDWPRIIAAVYGKAGLSAPVILEPSGCDTSRDARIGAFTLTLWPEGDKARINMAFGGATLDRSEARHLAAAIVAYGDAANAEPDPGEVDELAAVILSELYPNGIPAGACPSESDRTAARTALRWMAGKQREAGHV
jgi:hypothetical protein